MLFFIQSILLILITILGPVAIEAIYSSCVFKFKDISYNNHLKYRALVSTLILLFLVLLCILISIYL